MERRVGPPSLAQSHSRRVQLRFLELQVKTEDIQDARGRLYDVADPATMAFQVLDVRACAWLR